MNEYLIRTERSLWSERLTIGEVDGPTRWRFHGLSDVFRGRVATLAGMIAYFGVAYLPPELAGSVPLTLAALAVAGGAAFVVDRTMFSRYALRDPVGQPVVRLVRRLTPFTTRFRMEGPGGSQAEFVLDRKRTAIEVLGHDAVEVLGAPIEGRIQFVQRAREIGDTVTWSTDARDSLTLRIEAGPLEPFLIAAAALLDRTKRKARLPGPPPG